MTAVVVLAPKRGYAKFGKEAVARGTAAATMNSIVTDRISIKGRFPKTTPQRLDNSLHEHPVPVATKRWADGGFEGNVIVDRIGDILMAIFGTDTISGASPYTHKFTVNNTTPTYTVERNRGGLSGATNAQQYTNLVARSVTISGRVDQEGAFLRFAVDFIGKAPTLITTSAWTHPTLPEIPASLTAFSYAGATPDVLTDFSVTFERDADTARGANNAIDVSDAVATNFRVRGQIELYFLDWTKYSDFVATTERAISITTAIDANNSLALTIPKAYLTEEDPVEGETFIKQKFNVLGIYDSTAGNLSAAFATLINAVAVAY